MAEHVRHLREDALDGLFAGGVELPVPRLAAALRDLIRRFEAGLRLDVGDRDLCPFSGEQAGGRPANPVRSSGDHRNLVYGVSMGGLLVVSSLALSNIREAGGRAQALREAVRVLRPGGRLRIADRRRGPLRPRAAERRLH